MRFGVIIIIAKTVTDSRQSYQRTILKLKAKSETEHR